MQQEEKSQLALSSESSFQRSLRDRVGIFLEATSATEAINRIREAEQAGVRQIWGQNAGFSDILTVFAAVVTQTEYIKLGTAIVPAYPHHPLALARQAFAVHDLAPGRLRLGIGPGNRTLIEDWYGLKQTAPLSYLKEYVEIMRGVLWEGRTSYQGTFFNLSNDNMVGTMMSSILRKAEIPLLISAVGPKAFKLAGEIADGALSWVCPVPYLLDQANPSLHAGAESQQRPAPPIIAHMQIALSTDEAAIRAVQRPRLQMSAQIGPYARVFAKAGFSGALNGDEAELDKLGRTLLISGNEATIRSRIEELLTSGLDELLLTHLPIVDKTKEREQLLHLIGSL